MTEQLPMFEGMAPEVAGFKITKANGPAQGARRIGGMVAFVLIGEVVGVDHSVKDGLMVRTHTVEAKKVVELDASKGQELIDEIRDHASGQTRLEVFAEAGR